MLEVNPPSLQFDDVAVNDVPCYRQLRIRNLEAYPVVVQLSASSQFVKFQLENKNYTALTSSETVDFSEIYNELFDTIDLLDRVQLDIGEEKELIVLFQANPNGFAHIVVQPKPTVFSGSLQLTCASAVPGNSLFFPETFGGSSTSRVSDIKTPCTPSVVKSESVAISFRATIFLSFLQVSTSELQATMSANKTQVMEFTVTNLSCRPLSFVIRNQAIMNKGMVLELYESERFEEPKLGHRLLLDSQSSMKFSLMARTASNISSLTASQFRTILQCDNLSDCRNTTLIYVNVHVVGESQGDLITISDSSVNFGDVYRGTKTTADINVMNVDGREEIIVRLDPVCVQKIEGDVFLLKDDSVVEEVSIPPQKGVKTFKIGFKPPYNEEQKSSTKAKFELEFLASSANGGRQQRIVVRCSAALFTSTIVATQTNINFGDCQVGQSKKATFSIENQSPLPGKIIIQLRSKIISIEGIGSRQNSLLEREIKEEFTIAPANSLQISLKITPQRVNPMYRKQLTIINTANPNEERIIINIEANNMPPTEAKLHNELYVWESVLQGSEKNGEASCAIVNVPLLIPYVVRSKVEYPLTLQVKSTSHEIEVFFIKDNNKSELLEKCTAELRRACSFDDVEDATRFSSAVSERVEELRKRLVMLLGEGEAFAREFTVEALSSIRVYALILRTAFTNEVITKEDGLSISIASVDVPRFVRLSYRLCATYFDLLGQKTKNFGEVNIGIKKTTKLSIVNRCRSVLYICVSKSRSVTAGHIRIEGSDKQSIYLAIRPYATKEIDVIFHPGIKGLFDEKVKLTNILDPKNSISVTFKATVIKADTFDVSPDSWSFGPIVVSGNDAQSQAGRVGAKFTVSNTSKARRQIRLRLDASGLMNGAPKLSPDGSQYRLLFEGVEIVVYLETELLGSSSGSTRKIEEQIEKLEQKLKIYKRKKKAEKAAIAMRRIESLKRALMGEEVDLSALEQPAGPEHDFSESEDESVQTQTSASKSRYQQADLLSTLVRDGILLPIMAPGEAVTILFGLSCLRVADQPLPAIQTNTLNLLLYEAKDQEVNRIVPIDITLTRPEGESGSPASASGSVLPAAPPVSLPLISLLSGDRRAMSSFMGSPLVVLRNCIVNDHTEFTILVRSTKSTVVVVLEPRRCGTAVIGALDARFKFFPRNGSVREDEALRIVVECTPRSVGPQKYFIPVKNLQNAADVQYFVVELNPTEEEELLTAEPKQLTFRDIVTPCYPNNSETQLVLIRSRFSYPHSLLIRSSKQSQIRLFEDPQCTIPLEGLIQRTFIKETVRVYVQYTPSPKSVDETARVINGGVIVEAITAAPAEGSYCVTGRTVIRVTVRVGGGKLSVPHRDLELASVSAKVQTATAKLTIYNPSNTFDIQTRLQARSANVVQVGDRSGGMGEWVLRPKEELVVPITIRLPAPGLIKEHLMVENRSAHQDPIPVTVTVLRHDEAVSAHFDADHSDGLLCLPVSAVARGEDGSLHLCSNESTTLTIRNDCSKDLVLMADLKGLPIQFGEREQSSDTYVALLKANQSQAVPWTLTAVPPLQADQVQSILHHGAATLRTTAEVHVAKVVDAGPYNVFQAFSRRHTPAVGQCVLLVPVVVSLAMSEGFASPDHINFGAVGQADSRRLDGRDSLHTDMTKSSAKIQLVNLSPYLPLRLQVECQPTIRFSSTRIEIPPSGTVEVEATLQHQLILSQGPFRFEAFFVNELNPENDIAVSFVGQHYWKVFRLTCGENEDVSESVSLPPLRLESSAVSAILSEVKWNVTATEQDVALDVHIQHNPKLENIVELLALNYDATASVERLTFQSDSNTNEGGGSGDGLVVGATGAAQSSVSRSKGALPASRSHRIRLRCVLRENSLAKLVNIFFGFKSKRQTEVWEFGRVAEIEKRLRSSASNNIWLGTVIFSNPLTEEEEIQVFGKVDPFSTFSMPSKLFVRPVRVRPTSMTNLMKDADDNTSLATYYVGEVTITNTCEGYVAQLSLQVLFSDHLSIPLRVDVTTTPACLSHVSSQSEVSKAEREVPDPTTVFTSHSGGGAKANSNPLKLDAPEAHAFKVPPMDHKVLKIVIRAADNDVKNIQQSLLEQYISIVVTDDNVPFSINVSRVSITAVEADADEEAYGDERRRVMSAPKSAEVDSSVEASVAQTLVSSSTNASLALTTDGGPGVVADAASAAVPVPAALKPGTQGDAKLLIPQQVLTLKNCAPVQGCTGAYSLNLSFPREDAPQTDIGVRNNLTDRSVEYTVSVTSQSPQPWLLGSGTSTLEPGETQNLRLSILSVEAGSFVSYLSISNSANPSEVVYLRLSAEVFLPSAGEGLFEIISSTGQRVTSNTTRTVSMGHLYGSGTHRSYIALEIVNRGNLALEFPVSVVKPFRLELKPLKHQGLHSTDHGHHEHRSKDAGSEKALVSNASSLFDGKLVVCHIYGVPTASRQKYIVVDPKSRVRLAFLLTCNQLHAPPGYGVSGEADVVFRCKETRDSHFTFKAKFELYPPTFEVKREYYLTVDATKTCGETSVVVSNLLSVPQSFAFRTQSPVLYVVGGTGSAVEDVVAFNTVMDSAAASSASFATIEVPPRSTGYFAIRVDSMRAAALLNFDKDEGAHPILVEHAHILNVGNPMERAHLRFHQSSASNQSAIVPSIKPVKVGGQYISEHYIIRFAQQFTSTMSQCEERLLALFKFYEGTKTTDATHAPSMSTTSTDEDESDNLNGSRLYDASPDQASVLSSEDTFESTTRRTPQRGNVQPSSDTSRPTRLSPAEWQAIHTLLLDLIWLVDELVYYSILLCNSRHIDSYCRFVTAAVMNHPVMRAWRQCKHVFPTNRNEGVFAQFIETLDALPCPSPSLSSS